jgi:hypothetical protein
MISLPFGLFVLISLADSGTFNQLTALLALMGFLLLILTWMKPLTKVILFIHGLSFVLLAAPIANRLTDVPIHLFYYGSFIIPLCTFVIFYTLAIVTSVFLINKGNIAATPGSS